MAKNKKTKKVVQKETGKVVTRTERDTTPDEKAECVGNLSINMTVLEARINITNERLDRIVKAIDKSKSVKGL
jgi:chaperonin cofactor prefoldin